MDENGTVPVGLERGVNGCSTRQIRMAMNVSGRRAAAPLLFALASMVLPGCSDAPETSGSAAAPAAPSVETPGEQTGSAQASSPGGGATHSPPLKVVDEQRFREIVAANRGKVVLADFWATWCVECLELMPHTVRLQEALRDRGLCAILVSFDSTDQRQRVEEVLAEKGVTFESYISQYGADVKSAEAFEIERATLPHLKLFDRKGVLRKVFSTGRMPPEPFGPEDIEKAVRQLLAE